MLQCIYDYSAMNTFVDFVENWGGDGNHEGASLSSERKISVDGWEGKA